MKKAFGVIIALIMVALVAFIVLDDGKTIAPSFRVNNLNGTMVDNSRLQGKVTLLNFWYPSCPGCVSEMPKLIKMAQDYQGKDFQILAVAAPIDPLERVQEYAKQHALPFDVMFDADKKVVQAFIKNELYPTSFLIDKQGKVIQQFVGEPSFPALYQTVDAELGK